MFKISSPEVLSQDVRRLFFCARGTTSGLNYLFSSATTPTAQVKHLNPRNTDNASPGTYAAGAFYEYYYILLKVPFPRDHPSCRLSCGRGGGGTRRRVATKTENSLLYIF